MTKHVYDTMKEQREQSDQSKRWLNRMMKKFFDVKLLGVGSDQRLRLYMKRN